MSESRIRILPSGVGELEGESVTEPRSIESAGALGVLGEVGSPPKATAGSR
jgi:hypothetical protein